MAAIGIFVGCLVIVLLLADFFYKVKRTPWPLLRGTINNRSGVVVSHWPLDLRVTINTENLKTGKREWITDWRWNCKFIKKEN